MKWLRAARGWLTGLFSPQPFVVISTNDMPDELLPRELYVVGAAHAPWCVALACPCGCGELIQLSLLENDSPRWTLSVFKRQPTLSPSIWRTEGCEAHFFLRNGVVIWVYSLWRHPDDDSSS